MVFDFQAPRTSRERTRQASGRGCHVEKDARVDETRNGMQSPKGDFSFSFY